MHPVQIRLLKFPNGRLYPQIQSSNRWNKYRAEDAKYFLKQLLWLPIKLRIHYKLSLLSDYRLHCPSVLGWTCPDLHPLILCVLFRLIAVVVMPSASLLHISGILFLSLSITALLSPPSKLVIKLSLHTVFWPEWSEWLFSTSFLAVRASVCVCVCVCMRAYVCAFYGSSISF